MDLFSEGLETTQPLAARMRPRSIDEFIGQEHILGPGRLLRRAIQADQLSSIIFYGPPGCGKTTLARVIANSTKSSFTTLNAVLTGVKELRESIETAKRDKEYYGKRTILFVDEVHRWNKSQQDALLPWVENGTVVLIGATTQNPYFEVNPALVSRSRIFQLTRLSKTEMADAALAALKDTERGYGKYRVQFEEGALEHLVDVADGDARSLLNALELAVETTPEKFPPPQEEIIFISLKAAEESIQQKAVLYDKEGDYHFDTISAFIKSIRGSDPDAAQYWLARMVAAGEDPHFIFRRMLILASEDIGMADPQALIFTQAAASAFDRIGLPEGRYHLAHAVLYLSTAPKSNSCMGFFDALERVMKEEQEDVPSHLKDASRDKKGFGHGEGYLYPHAYKDHWAAQQYLPAGLAGSVFYEPSDQGYEARIRDEVARKRETALQAGFESEGREIYTWSPENRELERWVSRTMEGRSNTLSIIREKLFTAVNPRRHDRILIIGSGSMYLALEALRRCPEGGVWYIGGSRKEQEQAAGFGAILAESVDGMEEGVRVEAVMGRNLFAAGVSEHAALVLSKLVPGGALALSETIPSRGQRLSALLSDKLPKDLADRFIQAEESLYTDEEFPRFSIQIEDMKVHLKNAGFTYGTSETVVREEERMITGTNVDEWFDTEKPGSYKNMLLARLEVSDVDIIESRVRTSLIGNPLHWKVCAAILTAYKPQD